MTPQELETERTQSKVKNAYEDMRRAIAETAGPIPLCAIDNLARLHILSIKNDAQKHGQSPESTKLLLQYIAVKIAAKDY